MPIVLPYENFFNIACSGGHASVPFGSPSNSTSLGGDIEFQNFGFTGSIAES